MKTVEIQSVGEDKTTVITQVRNATGWGIKESKDFVDLVETEGPQVLDNVMDSDAEIIVQQLASTGAIAVVLGDNSTLDSSLAIEYGIKNASECVSDSQLNKSHNNNSYSRSALEDVSKMEANELVVQLEEWRRPLEQMAYIEKRLPTVNTEIVLSKVNIDNGDYEGWQWSKFGGIMFYVFIVIFTIAGFLALSFIGAIVGLIGGIVFGMKGWRHYDARHNKELNKEAIERYSQKIQDLEKEYKDLSDIRSILQSPESNPGSKLLQDYYTIYDINEMIGLLKTGRADNYKELLNCYDTIAHQNRMEAMQRASLIESAKQTAYAQQTEKNTHQAATAAKATAHHTRQIARNTRRFR